MFTRAILFGVCLCFSCGNVVGEMVVFDNGGPFEGAPIAEGALSADVDDVSFIEAADDFSLALDSNSFDVVQWWGVYGSGTTPANDGFSLNIYNDSSGSPGSLFQSIALNSVTRVDSGFQNGLANLTVYEYTASVNEVSLTADTTYWLGIANDSDNNNWGWVTHDPFSGNAHIFSAQNLNWGVPQNTEVAFRLLRVPEPSTSSMFVIAAATYLFRRRRPMAAGL